ncbi:MAG: hydrogenase nickel incorporation protein HypA [Dictyoglomaceae bacterium]
MHEWALADAVVSSVLALTQRKSLGEVREVFLKIGEIQQIDLEIFDFALKELSKGTLLETTKINYEIHPAIIHCNLCDYRWSYKESFDKLKDEEKEAIHFIPETIHVYICCPKCGSRDFDIEEGRGVWVEDVK